MDDFENLVNNRKEHYFKQIEESRENNKRKLQKADDYLNKFEERQEEVDEAVNDVLMRARIDDIYLRNDEVNTALEHQKAFKRSIISLKEKKAGVLQEEKDFRKLEKCIQEQHDLLHQQILAARNRLHKGLTPERIQQFRTFEADESLVGEKCAVCLNEFEVGREMMQLDCDGLHEFCQECVERWLANHNTCPVCREKFENVLL